MKISDAITTSLRNVTRHPLRAALTALSMAVGIATLVVVAAGEQSWRQALDRWYDQQGVDVLQVYRSSRPIANLPRDEQETRDLLAHCASITTATPVVEGSQGGSGLPVAGAHHKSCGVRGILPGFEGVFGTRLLRGRFFTDEDERTRADVCILDAEASRALFGNTDMVGRWIRVGGYRLRVIGVSKDLSTGGLAGMMGILGGAYEADVERISHLNAGLIVPLSTARRTMGLPVTRLCARSTDHAAAIGEIGRYLDLDLKAAGNDSWAHSLAAEKAAALAARQKLQLFLGAAAVLLLVSCGVALASVMYVAVNDRQREIGILRACGATSAVVGRTFLMEGLWIGIVGGAAGLALGLPAATHLSGVTFPQELSGLSRDPVKLATSLLPGMTQSANWQALAVATAASWAMAVVAASLPAGAAAQLRPAEAIASTPHARYRLRRVLAVLQLAIGVAAVLLLTALHEGVALNLLGEMVHFSQADMVEAGLRQTRSRQEMPVVQAPFAALALDPSQVDALARECPDIRALNTAYLITPLSAKCGDRYEEIGASAVTAGFFGAERLHLEEGRFFTGDEVRRGDRVIVLTDETAGSLGLEVAVGKTVRLDGLPFRVVGVVAHSAENRNDSAYIPVTSVAKPWVNLPYGGANLIVHLRSPDHYEAAERQFIAALTQHLPARTMHSVLLFGNAADRYRLSALRRAAALRASVIGFSALLIALIGLVNMLLVSVSEQIREIGLRRALGATRASIARGVIAEALLICLPGCLAGLGIGVLASRLLGGWAHLATAVPAFWIVVSAGAALGGGLLVSLLPASRATLIAPVEALRHE